MNKKSQFQARLENQKSQLERHGNFAEVVIRTTPEGTDMINFARLWEHVLVQADRQTRGYMSKSGREDFDKTHADFEEAMQFMAHKLQACIQRHNLDLTGNNFISRVAQRYKIADRKRAAKPQAPAEQPAPKPAKKAAETPAPAPAEQEKPAAEKPQKKSSTPVVEGF